MFSMEIEEKNAMAVSLTLVPQVSQIDTRSVQHLDGSGFILLEKIGLVAKTWKAHSPAADSKIVENTYKP